ncbi:MAG: YcxB family protein [Clostridiaceae bacterium]|nr:YcxB family protein [Clostridiaceae bacterium]
MKTRLKQSEIDQAVKTVVKSEVFKGMRKYIIFVIIVFPVILLLLSSQVTSKLLPGLAADREADNQSLLITYLPVILVVLFILIGLMYDLLLVKNNRKKFYINSRMRRDLSYVFTREGLECITDRQVTRVPWERMHKITETEEAVMIFSSESIFWLIPKRFFEGNDFERFVYMVYPMFLNKKIEKLIKKSASRIPKDKKG